MRVLVHYLSHSFFLLLLVATPAWLSGQEVQQVREWIKPGPAADHREAFVSIALPLGVDSQRIQRINASVTPTQSIDLPGEHAYIWEGETLRDVDSLLLTYLYTAGSPGRWQFDRERLGDSLRTLRPGRYPLPEVSRSDFERTPYAGLRETDRARIVDRILRTFERRVKVTNEPAKFDLGQPLLQDLHRRLTTERRFAQLLSLALQYYGIDHRLVSGKVLLEGSVFENQLWVEIAVGEGWRRLPPTDNGDFLRAADTWGYAVCAYDYRVFTLELYGLPQADWRTTYQPFLMTFWEAKNAALVKKDYTAALSQMDSMLNYAPTMITAISEKGLVLTQAGEETEGLRYLQYALDKAESDSDNSISLIQLAKYYTLKGMNTEALEAIARANTFVSFNLSQLYNDDRFDKLLKDRRAFARLTQLYGVF